MCLAVPGKVLETFEENGLLMGKIDFAGTVNRACLSYCSDVKVGQYVIVHAGFAINVLDEEEALSTLQIFKEMSNAVEKNIPGKQQQEGRERK